MGRKQSWRFLQETGSMLSDPYTDLKTLRFFVHGIGGVRFGIMGSPKGRHACGRGGREHALMRVGKKLGSTNATKCSGRYRSRRCVQLDGGEIEGNEALFAGERRRPRDLRLPVDNRSPRLSHLIHRRSGLDSRNDARGRLLAHATTTCLIFSLPRGDHEPSFGDRDAG